MLINRLCNYKNAVFGQEVVYIIGVFLRNDDYNARPCGLCKVLGQLNAVFLI